MTSTKSTSPSPWSALAIASSLFGVTFGIASFSVFIGGLGAFYGPGWIGLTFLVGLPLSLLSLVFLKMSPLRARSLAGGITALLGVAGFVLASCGAGYVLRAVLTLL